MRLTASAPVAASQEAVFARVTQIEAHPALFRRVASAALITPAPVGVGSVWSQIVRVKGASYDLRQTVTELRAPSRAALKAVVMGVAIHTFLDLEATGPQACRLSLTLDLEPESLPGRMALAGLARLQDKAEQAIAAEARAAAQALSRD